MDHRVAARLGMRNNASDTMISWLHVVIQLSSASSLSCHAALTANLQQPARAFFDGTVSTV